MTSSFIYVSADGSRPFQRREVLRINFPLACYPAKKASISSDYFKSYFEVILALPLYRSQQNLHCK